MCLDNFFRTYKVTHQSKKEEDVVFSDEDFHFIISSLGRKTFNGGLYRVFNAEQIDYATFTMGEVFPEYKDRIQVFGYDWSGRHFAVDGAHIENGKRLILLLDPGSGEALHIPFPIIDFHNKALIEYMDASLAFNFFNQWRENNPEPIFPSECIGYIKPLFLGGCDDVTNLEKIDLDVYISFCAQLRAKISDLPDGTVIGDVTID